MSLILPHRSEVPVAETWALDDIYVDAAAAEAEVADVERRVTDLATRAGGLAVDPTSLRATLDALEALSRARGRLSSYFRLPVAADQTDAAARAQAGRLQGLMARWARALAFVEPELLAVEPERLAAYLDADPGLARYRPFLRRLEERRPHVRSPEVEGVLAGAAGVFDAYEQARDALAEGDLRFERVADGAHERELAPSSYRTLVHDPDRGLRARAFERWTDGYLSVADTLAEVYLGRVRRTSFEAQVRGYPSGEAAALAGHRVPVEVLDATLTAFRHRLPVWHRYWAARRRLLGLDVHRPWDVFAPPPTAGLRVPYEQAAAWIVESAAPLGDDAVGVLRRGLLEERWVDRRPNRGKRQGAFCADAPDVHPFVFVSYGDDLSSASTLAHEMGHALHAVWAERHVCALEGVDALSMTVAETASNAQQALLRGYLLRHAIAEDPDVELALLDEAFGNLHRYLFVMPTLVRFEREVHARVGRDDAVSADDLTRIASELFAEAYGPEVVGDGDEALAARMGVAWAEFPHLYAPFYTFQYTVGIAVALALVARIEAGGAVTPVADGAVRPVADGAVRPVADGAVTPVADGAVTPVAEYLAFLAAGGSVPPVEAFARLGFDVTTPAPVEAAFDVVEALVARLERHAERLGR